MHTAMESYDSLASDKKRREDGHQPFVTHGCAGSARDYAGEILGVLRVNRASKPFSPWE